MKARRGGALGLWSALAVILASAATAEPPVEFLYVTNYWSHTVSAYRIDAGSGALQPVTGSPFATSGRSVSAAVDPSNRFLYVVSRDASGVEGFAIGPTGALTPLPGSPFPGGPSVMDPSSVVVVPSGRFLYITDTLFDRVRGYGIDVATGALSPVGTPVPLGANGDALSVDPSGRFLYAARSGFTDDLYGFWLDSSTGGLSPVSGPLPLGGRCGGTAVDPSGRYLFAASGPAGVAAFTLGESTGAPSEREDSPVPAGTSADVTLTPSGRFAYVTDWASGQIQGFGLDAATGALKALAGAPATTGASPGQLVVDPSNRFVYTVNRADDSVSGYAIGPDGALGTGRLTKTWASATSTTTIDRGPLGASSPGSDKWATTSRSPRLWLKFLSSCQFSARARLAMSRWRRRRRSEATRSRP